MSDQRRNPRRPMDILLNKYIAGQPHLCRAVNISCGGMLIHKVFEPELPHLSVTIELELPGSQEVLCIEGVVLSAGRASRAMAIRFLRMPPRIAQLVERFVRSQTIAGPLQATV